MVADVGFIGYDIYRIIKDNLLNGCDNLGENLTALGADALGAVMPGVTGLGQLRGWELKLQRVQIN